MGTELFLGSFIVLTLVAVIILLMTLNRRVGYTEESNRSEQHRSRTARTGLDR